MHSGTQLTLKLFREQRCYLFRGRWLCFPLGSCLQNYILAAHLEYSRCSINGHSEKEEEEEEEKEVVEGEVEEKEEEVEGGQRLLGQR